MVANTDIIKSVPLSPAPWIARPDLSSTCPQTNDTGRPFLKIPHPGSSTSHDDHLSLPFYHDDLAFIIYPSAFRLGIL